LIAFRGASRKAEKRIRGKNDAEQWEYLSGEERPLAESPTPARMKPLEWQSTFRSDGIMGNPAGVRRTQKMKRLRKELERLAKKDQAATKETPKKDQPAK
jgi:hypothetical protein